MIPDTAQFPFALAWTVPWNPLLELRHAPSSCPLAGAISRARAESGKPTTIVFACLHGAVKRQVAAVHFNRIIRERGLPVVAVIREGLAGDGLAADSEVPIPLTSEETAAATKVFAFDEVPADLSGAAEVTCWSDVSPATKDYAAARHAMPSSQRGNRYFETEGLTKATLWVYSVRLAQRNYARFADARVPATFRWP